VVLQWSLWQSRHGNEVGAGLATFGDNPQWSNRLDGESYRALRPGALSTGTALEPSFQ
jgi:hypothetical protein